MISIRTAFACSPAEWYPKCMWNFVNQWSGRFDAAKLISMPLLIYMTVAIVIGIWPGLLR